MVPTATVLRGIDLKMRQETRSAQRTQWRRQVNPSGRPVRDRHTRGPAARAAGRPLRRGPHRRAAAGLAHVPEGRRVFADLTVADNLAYGAVASGQRPRAAHAARTQVLDVFPPLGRLLGRRAGQLSGGEQQMLAIGRGMMARPRLLMVDDLASAFPPTLRSRSARSAIPPGPVWNHAPARRPEPGTAGADLRGAVRLERRVPSPVPADGGAEAAGAAGYF